MLSLAHPETHVVEESRATPQGGMTVVYTPSCRNLLSFPKQTHGSMWEIPAHLVYTVLQIHLLIIYSQVFIRSQKKCSAGGDTLYRPASREY